MIKIAIRFRKSIKVAPGVKLNLGKKSAGVSFGNKYFRKSYSTSGRKTTSSSIPGTGITFMNSSTKKNKKSKDKTGKAVKVKTIKPQPEKVMEEVTTPNLGNSEDGMEPETRKFKLWPWIAMAVALLCGLGFLFGNGGDTPEVSDGESSVESSTQFSYSANDVELKMMNGVLTAYVGDKQVPYTGLVDAADGTYVVKDGVADTSYNGVYGNDNSLQLVKDGKLDTSSTGLINAGNGAWYYAQNGEVRKDYTGVQQNEFGRWYVNQGQIDFGYNGVARSEGSTYLIKEGKVDTSQNGVMQVDGIWSYVRDGMVNTNFTGVASNQYGDWYVKNGIVQLGYDGIITANGGQRYNVSKGSATLETTTAAYTERYNSGYSSGSSSYSHSGSYIASNKSRPPKFHRVNGCGGARQIKEENAVYFDSYDEAIKANYEPCKNCF